MFRLVVEEQKKWLSKGSIYPIYMKRGHHHTRYGSPRYCESFGDPIDDQGIIKNLVLLLPHGFASGLFGGMDSL